MANTSRASSRCAWAARCLTSHRGARLPATDFQYVGHTFVDDGNAQTNRSATIIDVRVGQRHALGPLAGELFVGLRNLLLDRYDDNIRVNATANRFLRAGTCRARCTLERACRGCLNAEPTDYAQAPQSAPQ